MSTELFKKAFTKNTDVSLALKNIADTLDAKNAKLSVLFVSNAYDIHTLSNYVREYFGRNVIACTTAGEICCEGYSENSITGIAFHGDDFVIDTIEWIDLKENCSFSEIEPLKEKYLKIKEKHLNKIKNGKTFSLLLVDGLSVKEEQLAGIIASSIEDTPLIGGSAGDGEKFNSTYVLIDGQFVQDAATLTFITTSIPFEIFKIQHIGETEKKIVITETDPESRTVKEIDGEPAAKAYAKLLGMNFEELSPTTFSEHPLTLKIGNDYFVRSIQRLNEDKSLTFYCAIDDGLVLTLGQRNNIIENLNQLFSNLEKKIGEVNQSLVFECILRKIEVNGLSLEDQATLMNTLKKNNAIGFHTYGEQYGGIHINQTMTRVAFGKAK
ncbi:MAG: FIST C-terminal domain-containing protein [Bdellovibrionales bacterium]|nr:FIST C-terminal domain-containing protein [Bdellovibrionales bacterium]